MSQVAFGQMNQAAMAQFGNVSRFSGGTQYAPIDDGGDAFQGRRSARTGASNGNFIGTVLTVAAVGVAAVAGMALTKKLFTPAILKNITSLRGVVAEEGGAIVNGSLKFASKEADKEVAGTLKYMENSGFLGFFRKAEIAVEGGATRTVRMWRVPGELGYVLKNTDKALPITGWTAIGKEGLTLGAHTLPAGAATTTDLLGKAVGATKSATAGKYTLYTPAADGTYTTAEVTFGELPAMLRKFFTT